MITGLSSLGIIILELSASTGCKFWGPEETPSLKQRLGFTERDPGDALREPKSWNDLPVFPFGNLENTCRFFKDRRGSGVAGVSLGSSRWSSFP